MITQACPWIEVLAKIPGFRNNRGKRNPLVAILALACSAVLCGYGVQGEAGQACGACDIQGWVFNELRKQYVR